MDYTSVTNIEKVINPLFMDDLWTEYDKVKDNVNKLNKLWVRISKIKVFDPTCGSGNFLIIAYKRLRELEREIIRTIDEISPTGIGIRLDSQIKLDHFFGIELEDFPRELAVLSMYIAAHQMNIKFEEEFGKKLTIIPIIDIPTIICGNSARLDWNSVCPNVPHGTSSNHKISIFNDFNNESEPQEFEAVYDEIYVIGNPPYKGTRNQTDDQKRDKAAIMATIDGSKNLDYVAIWFVKAAEYIGDSIAKACFVSTNSITQGDQVHILWPHILTNNIEIGFAYTSFKWTNNAKDQAGVTVVIISLQKHIAKKKKLFSNTTIDECDVINGFLIPMSPIYIERHNSSISGLPEMSYGNHTGGSKDLFITPEQREVILSEYPNASKFIRPTAGSAEYIRGIERYCLWIEDKDLEDAKAIKPINDLIEKIRLDRISSKEPGKKKTCF